MSTDLAPETIPESSPEARLSYRRTLRQSAIERRLALAPEVCTDLSTKICALLQTHFHHLSSQRVGFCWPVNNEPDLRPLIQSWIKANTGGFTALLPVVEASGQPLAFREWTPTSTMIADRFGIPFPTDGPFITPDALLIPVNAFDSAGYRIGYGGGFFDRTLASIKPPALAIGIGFELARIDSVHPEPHDVRLDAMVTEAGVFAYC
jgi:5-formyltetrahydrofolate cyclo-ligase